MQGRRQPTTGREVVLCAFGRDEMQRRLPLETVFDLRATAEIQKAGATADRDVLAVIDPLTGL
jgi:hypothetical protein